MSNSREKNRIISSLLWKYFERTGNQGVQFLVQIVLARLLLPEDFGLIAIVSVFILLANVFVQNGFNTALIQKKEADEIDFSSVFYMSLFVSTILYLIIFFTAPAIAIFYNISELVPVLRVISITLFFGAFNSIQNAYLAKKMMFKKMFFSSLGAVLVSGIIGIVMAYRGFGTWALVSQQLSNQIVITIILMFIVKWRPKLIFSLSRVKILFSFGWKLLVSSLLYTIYMELRSLIIGKIYSPASLGYYNRGQLFPKILVNNINGSIQSVMLPALSSYQDNVKKVKDMVRRAIVTSSFVMFPGMALLALVAKPLVEVVLTDKWLPAVIFLQIFCITYSLHPIHTANLQAINAMGRSDIFLKLEIIKRVIGIGILGVTIPFGIYAMAWGTVASAIVSSFVNAFPNNKLLRYNYFEQLKDIAPSFILTCIMAVPVYFVANISENNIITIFVQLTLGAVIYIGLAGMLKLESFMYLISTMKELLLIKFKK